VCRAIPGKHYGLSSAPKLAQVAGSASKKPIREPAEPELSEEARHVLLEAAKDPHGTVLMLKTTGGFALQAHGQQLIDGNDVRVEAAYREAVNDLVSRRLLETRGGKGEVFTLTKRRSDLLSAFSRPSDRGRHTGRQVAREVVHWLADEVS
jgi:hypothetical protein